MKYLELYRYFANTACLVSRDSPSLHWIVPLCSWPDCHCRAIEVHEAGSASVDPPVELAVCGLCQNDIKDIGQSAEDAVAAVKRSFPSLSVLLTPLSATQQAY